MDIKQLTEKLVDMFLGETGFLRLRYKIDWSSGGKRFYADDNGLPRAVFALTESFGIPKALRI